MSQGEYVQGADGKMYREVEVPGGESDFVEVDARDVEFVASGKDRYIAFAKGDDPNIVEKEGAKFLRQSFKDSDGKEQHVDIPVADEEAFRKQAGDQSHKKYFESMADDKQKARRSAKMGEVLQAMVSSQVDPGASSQIRVIKDKEYFDLNSTYQQALREGWAAKSEFQPLAVYRMKVQRARPILKGEIGIIVKDGMQGIKDGNSVQILRLEEGYGEGTLIQVPVQVENKEEVSLPPEFYDGVTKLSQEAMEFNHQKSVIVQDALKEAFSKVGDKNGNSTESE